MSRRILILATLSALAIGCVERHEYEHVTDDLPGVDVADVQGGDALLDVPDLFDDRGASDGCAPDCEGRICGPDGCGGSCGACGEGYDCSPGGDACMEDCEALCDGLECGTAGLDEECDCGDCDDENDCTDDYCGAGTCVYDPLDQECDDDDPCTVGDWCVGGACQATDKDCGDGNPCTNDLCTDDGDCDHEHNTASCDDDDPCTESDICSEGVCAGTDKSCDDGNDCTLDSCGDAGVCDHDPVAMNAEPCEDGNPCTDDLCSGGACVGTPKPVEDLVALECICAEDADCAQFEDGDVCDGTMICDKHDEGDEEGICKVDAGTLLTCTDDIECTVNACEPLSGCTNVPDPEACPAGGECQVAACDAVVGCLLEDAEDDTPCTDGVCQAGVCVCVPDTCESLDKDCGDWPDGCGGDDINCGDPCD